MHVVDAHSVYAAHLDTLCDEKVANLFRKWATTPMLFTSEGYRAQFSIFRALIKYIYVPRPWLLSVLEIVLVHVPMPETR